MVEKPNQSEPEPGTRVDWTPCKIQAKYVPSPLTLRVAWLYLLSLLSFLLESSLFILLSLDLAPLPRMLATLREGAYEEDEFGAATLLEPEHGWIH